MEILVQYYTQSHVNCAQTIEDYASFYCVGDIWKNVHIKSVQFSKIKNSNVVFE